MSATDFFDDDLVRQRDGAKRIKMGPGDEPIDAGAAEGDGLPQGVSELNLTRMARHRKEVDNATAVASQELERLRSRQEELEKEKRSLEELRTKHEEYGRGKREMVEHLKRSMVSLERREVEAERLLEQLKSSRQRFREMLGVLEALREDTWPQDQVREELARALGVIEECRSEYNKSLAKIDALKADPVPAATAPPTMVYEDHAGGAEEKNFAYWLKVGAAASLPLALVLILIAVLFFVALTGGFI